MHGTRKSSLFGEITVFVAVLAIIGTASAKVIYVDDDIPLYNEVVSYSQDGKTSITNSMNAVFL